MYAFQKAWTDFGRSVKYSAGRLNDFCRGIWDWCWNGKGCRIFDWIIRIMIVSAGIVLAILYAGYEEDRGRGFSLAIAGAFALIMCCVWILLWGWKAPAHWVARFLSAMSAVSMIIGLSILYLAIMGLFYFLYMTLLTTLTALSVFLFIPVRLIHYGSLLYRNISYRCPHTDCRDSREPIHVFGGVEYKDLIPNFYGVFRHTFWYNGKYHRIPTLDILGRRDKVDRRLCRGCGRELRHHRLGEYSVRPIALVGGPSAGKTVYMRQACRQLIEEIVTIPHAVIRISSRDQENDHNRECARLKQGVVLDKTVGDIFSAFVLEMALPKPNAMKALIYNYDVPGDTYDQIDRFAAMQSTGGLYGIILLVDPFASALLAPYGRSHAQNLKPSETSLKTVVESLIAGIRAHMTDRDMDKKTGKIKMRVAVVLNKADALPADSYPFLEHLCGRNGILSPREKHDLCREALNKMGESNCIMNLESHFTDVRYFSCSSLGRMPKAGSNEPFEAFGVTDPYRWVANLPEK